MGCFLHVLAGAAALAHLVGDSCNVHHLILIFIFVGSGTAGVGGDIMCVLCTAYLLILARLFSPACISYLRTQPYLDVKQEVAGGQVEIQRQWQQ